MQSCLQQQQAVLQQPLRCAPGHRLLRVRSNALVQAQQPPPNSLGPQQPQHSSQQLALQRLTPAAAPRCSKQRRGPGSGHTRTRTAAAAGDSSTPAASSLSAQPEALAASCDVLYRFTRPHTMLGTLVSIVSVSIMAMQSFTWTAPAVSGLLQALVPALLMNVAIVGINQLYDVEIDKVNKPYLPLASGELSMQQGERVGVPLLRGGVESRAGKQAMCTNQQQAACSCRPTTVRLGGQAEAH